MDSYLLAASLFWLYVLACILDDAVRKNLRSRPGNWLKRVSRFVSRHDLGLVLSEIKAQEMIAY